MINKNGPLEGGIQSLLRLCVGMKADLERQRLFLEELAVTVKESQARHPDPVRLMTTEDLSAAWQVSVRTLESLVAEASISPTYIKGARRFSVEAVEAYERAATGRRRSARRRTKTKSSPVGQGAPDRGPLNSSHGGDNE